ncbi:glycosyl transferase [Marichromatium sp. AB31]|uniref:glycosyl transferase n=1 Tax=Marichromatium sp. AB31 TaxID=2483362 RepID=UPI000F413453|nr:glycosyl transferase [Marichromatium sp. AB31]RNE91977.1 glycosyl transferase [Marichromatium sp. AB31]
MIPQTPILAVAVLAALLLSALATRWLSARAGTRFGALDVPNARSLHSAPVPRTGGLAVLLGLALPLLALAVLGLAPGVLGWIALALAPVAAVAFVDDLGEVAPRWRLLAQVLGALVLIAVGLRWGVVELPGVAWALPLVASLPLTLLAVVWMTNLYNFMDGMDGLAASMTLFGFGALALLGWKGGEPGYAAVAGCVAAAGAGFLSGNFPPARIFLGDVGSASLGLLAAALALWGAQLGLFPLWVALLAFSPFVVDATWTLLVRLARGERVWQAHRSHHYQRLVLAGWSHRRTLLRAQLLMAAASACAVAAPGLVARDQWLVIGAWCAIYLLVHLKVGLVERAAAGSRA